MNFIYRIRELDMDQVLVLDYLSYLNIILNYSIFCGMAQDSLTFKIFSIINCFLFSCICFSNNAAHFIDVVR